jgi:hypothetical protein
MINTTHPEAGTVFLNSGDWFLYTLQPAPGCQPAPNGSAYRSQSINGADFTTPSFQITLGSNGVGTGSGPITSSIFGAYKEVWTIQYQGSTIPSPPELAYQVVNAASLAAPATTTTEFVYLGDRALAEIHSPPAVFTDLSPTAAYANDVDVLAADGIVSGCSATTFCPSNSVTRAQMAVWVVRSIFTALNGAAQANNFSYPTTACFSDVGSSNPSFQWIQKACQLGLVATGGSFYPNQNAENQDALGFVIRAGLCVASGAAQLCGGGSLSYPSTPQYFADVPSSSANYPDVQAAVAQSIIPTTTAYPTTIPDCSTQGDFCATTQITRSLAAMWIVRGVLGDLSY